MYITYPPGPRANRLRALRTCARKYVKSGAVKISALRVWSLRVIENSHVMTKESRH